LDRVQLTTGKMAEPRAAAPEIFGASFSILARFAAA